MYIYLSIYLSVHLSIYHRGRGHHHGAALGEALPAQRRPLQLALHEGGRFQAVIDKYKPISLSIYICSYICIDKQSTRIQHHKHTIIINTTKTNKL